MQTVALDHLATPPSAPDVSGTGEIVRNVQARRRACKRNQSVAEEGWNECDSLGQRELDAHPRASPTGSAPNYRFAAAIPGLVYAGVVGRKP